MKTKEELDALKKEVAALNEKLNELSDEELNEVAGGVAPALQLNLESVLFASGGNVALRRAPDEEQT